MVVKFLRDVYVTIAREGNLGTWEISAKRNSAMINIRNNTFRIFWDSTFGVVAALGR